MKTFALAVLTLCMASAAVPAQAGNGHRGHGYDHRGWGHGGHYYRGGGGHRSHHNHNGAYLVGGLILGSVLTSAYHRANDRDYYEPYPVTRTVYRTVPSRVVSHEVIREVNVPPAGRTLFRDRHGNCFERNYNDDGDEVLYELDPSDCDW